MAMTITVTPEHEFDLGARASRLLTADAGGILVAGVYGGRVLVLDSSLTLKACYGVGGNLQPQAASEDGRVLALTAPDTLLITTVEGKPLCRETAPVFRGAGFEACIFSADVERLWVVRHVDNDQVHLERRSAPYWRVDYSVAIDEPAPPTSFCLSAHPEKQVLILWGAAGQDGQWVYWVLDDGRKIHVRQDPQLVFTTPPDFHPAGGEFVVVGEYQELRRYDFPECNELDSFVWPEADENDGMGGGACYVSDSHVLLNRSSGRLFLVNLSSMQIAEEVHIRGHEPRPTRELYNLLNEDGLSTDLQWFRSFREDHIASIHHQLPCEDMSDKAWKDTLALWRFPPTCGKMSKPDAAATLTTRFRNRL
jgi:hypothetical protein